MADSNEKDVEKRRLRDEVAELAGQVAGLRAELAAARAGQHCHGSHQCFALMSHPHCNWGHCWCYTVHFQSWPVPGCAPQPPVIYYTANVPAVPVAIGAAAGVPTAYTLALGN
jgi:hypothetical protein